MFGKTVKIRRCPATVSAPPAQESGQMPLGSLQIGDTWEGGSERRKSGDRSIGANHLLLVPRGTEDTNVFV